MKTLIKRLIFILAYYLGVDSIFFFLNRKAKRIIVFHNVLEDTLYFSGPPNTTSMPFSEFKKIIDICVELMPISTDVFDSKTLTITFDDGYRNQYSTAFPYLNELRVPAIVFVTEQINDGLAIDKAVLWTALVSEKFLPGNDRVAFWYNVFWLRFLMDGKSRGVDTLKWLDNICPFTQVFSRLSERYLKERLGAIGEDGLQEMRDAGWVVGWHTKTHFPLSGLSDEDLIDELTPTASFSREVMAYPFGSEKLVGDEAQQIAEKCGFKVALSYTNSSKSNVSRYFAARLPSIGKDKYEIAALLSGFNYFVSYKKLLPLVEGR